MQDDALLWCQVLLGLLLLVCLGLVWLWGKLERLEDLLRVSEQQRLHLNAIALKLTERLDKLSALAERGEP
jgi:hypothetical protein